MKHDRLVIFLFGHRREAPTVLVSWTRDAEASASSDASASCYGVKEDIGILAIVESPRKLIQVQRKIFRAHVVIGADDPTLQKRPEALNRVSVNVSSHVFASRMRDRGVRIPCFFQMPIFGVFVRRNQRHFVRYRFAHELPQRIESGVFDHLTGDIAFARDRSDYHCLVACVRSLAVAALVPVAILVLAPDPSFVGFNFAHQLRELIVVEHRANAMAHIEGGFVRRLLSVLFEHPLDLQSAHPLLGLANQIDDLKPQRELVVCVLEHGPYERREAITGFLRAFVYLAGSSVHNLRAALTNPIPRAMLDSDYLAASASRAFDAVSPAKTDQQFHTLVLGFVPFMNLSKADHKRTLHQFSRWCQVRQMGE
jgi:hypothetical protein